MVPIQPPEPSKLLETKTSINARKIRFEINHLQLPIGVKGTFGMIKHPGAALAVPITEQGEIIILRQYRFAVEQRILEFPAGTLEVGEDPLSTMKRELAEEAGYIANHWEEIGLMLPCPGYSDEVINLYLARDLEEIKERPPGDEDEDLEILKMTQKEFESCIEDGNELLDGKTITAWFRAKQVLEKYLCL